jgi:autotransporter translocation and assembly factor TamB
MIRLFKQVICFVVLVILVAWLLLPVIIKKSLPYINENFIHPTGFHLNVGNVSYNLSGNFVFYDVLFKQSDTPLFTAEEIELSISVKELINGDLPGIVATIPHAKLVNIPKINFPESAEQTRIPEITLFIGQLEIDSVIAEKVDLPNVLIKSALLNKVRFHTFENKQEVSGKMVVESRIDNQEIRLHSEFIVDQERNLQADFNAVVNGNIPFNGHLQISPTLSLEGSNIMFPLTNLALLHPILGDLNSEGTIEADCIVSGEVHSPEFTLNIRSHSLSINKMVLDDLFLHSTFRFLDGVIGHANLHVEGIMEQQPLLINTEASWNYQNGNLDAHINSLSGIAYTLPFSLLEPIKINKNNQHTKADSFALNIGRGGLKGSLSLSDDTINATLNLEELPLSAFPWKSDFIENMADGKYKDSIITLNSKLTGSLSNPQAIIHAIAKDAEGSTSADLDVFIQNNQISGKGTITSSNLPTINGSFALPVSFSLNPIHFTYSQEAPLSGKIEVSGEMGQILHSLLDSPTSVSGHTQISLDLAGTLENPSINGTGSITNGTYEIPGIGVLLSEIAASIEINGNQLIIKHIEATDGKTGKVAGTGYYHIDNETNYPFSLELVLQDATLLNQDYVHVVCNGPLSFKGNNEEGSINGQLQVSDASVVIPERSYSTINTVDVVYINNPENAPKPQSLEINQTRWPLALDIHLNIPKSLTITGKDLDSSWKGELAVQGTAKTPLLFGDLKIVYGEYLFNGNPFSINQGMITLAGELDKKTTLYVIAHKDLDEVKVDVIVKGPVKNPAISFRSNPPLSQREILSWILFNRGTTEISPFQGAQLSESITNLSTPQQGPDVLSRIRSTFKIDRFEISRNPNDNNGGVNVQVGKYISDNVLITVIKSDVNRVAVEAALTDTIKLRAQVGDDSEGQLLIKWKRDY